MKNIKSAYNIPLETCRLRLGMPCGGGQKSVISNAASLTGFTLVELLVVISIIAMLLGITVPVLSMARAKAKRAVCKANLHSISLSFRMYLDDNKNTLPCIDNMPNTTIDTVCGGSSKVSIFSALSKYFGDPKILHCPADNGTVIGTSFFGGTPQSTKDAGNYFLEQGSSYEYNGMMAQVKLDGLGRTFTRRNGTTETIPWAEFWIIRDYSGFHPKTNSQGAGSVQYLFADTLVADRERNK